jgi:predicted negative regulator of RcsB-dependent stress response
MPRKTKGDSMKLRARYSTATTVLAAALMAYSAGAIAQVNRGNPDERRAQKAAKAEEQVVENFPNATRQSPHQQATKQGGSVLHELVELYQAKNYAETLTKADALLATTDNAYERSFASQIAANAAAESGDDAKAVTYFKQAIDANGLDNNDHYVAMYNLAVTQYKGKQYADALKTLERLTGETKSDTPEYSALKGTLLANLDRPLEAAALYEQMSARDPADKKSLMNAVALYQQAGNFAKADALLAGAKGKGQLTTPDEYRALYVGYINAGKLQDAISTIDEGLAKGVVQPSADLVKVYAVIAQTAYGNSDSKLAIDMYGRAAAISGDGEQGLNLAKVLLNEGRTAEAKKAAQQALDKGLKNPEEARRILALGGK